MILRSGDILVMGGKSRLRVHAVPKVYTKSLPPSYLHPRSAGSAIIHTANCPHFLQANRDNLRGKSSINNTTLMQPALCRDMCDCIQTAGLKRSISKSDLESCVLEETTDSVDKRYRCHDRADLDPALAAVITEGSDDNRCIEEDEVEGAKEKESDIHIDAESCCSAISVDEEIRILRFLQTTRINFNVRQVYCDPLVTQ
jgi:hypothetical protein